MCGGSLGCHTRLTLKNGLSASSLCSFFPPLAPPTLGSLVLYRDHPLLWVTSLYSQGFRKEIQSYF